MQDVVFNRPALVGREIQYIRDAIRRGQLSEGGYYMALCNARIAEMTGAQSALLTHSCTAALEMVETTAR